MKNLLIFSKKEKHGIMVSYIPSSKQFALISASKTAQRAPGEATGLADHCFLHCWYLCQGAQTGNLRKYFNYTVIIKFKPNVGKYALHVGNSYFLEYFCGVSLAEGMVLKC